jgi:prepilin-type N-terminal cleavage/methylation domain-containing protein
MITSSYRKGFTLLETMAATAILAFVIIGPLATIVNSSSYARKTKDTMTAMYLAEGNVEMLQNRYDSIYVLCRKLPDDPACMPLLGTNETSAQIAWRLFKTQLASVSGQTSCFINDTTGTPNPLGCSFDSLDMTGTPTSTPTRYVAGSPECSALVDVAVPISDSASPGNTQAGGVGSLTTNNSVRHIYRCSGVGGRVPTNAVVSAKSFNRSVTLEQIPTSFETNPDILQHYNDDIRIVSKVEFRTFRNSTTSVMITRFMHAHQ